MRRTIFALFLFTVLGATAQAPDIHYSLNLSEDYITRNLASARMYSNIAQHGDPYMAGYFAGRAEVYAEFKLMIEWMKKKPIDK